MQVTNTGSPLPCSKRTAVEDLGVARAWLGELARHARDAHCGDARAPDEHEAHLDHDLELLLDQLRLTVLEALGAVAALQQEALAIRHLRELLLQRLDLLHRHQARERAHCNRTITIHNTARPSGIEQTHTEVS